MAIERTFEVVEGRGGGIVPFRPTPEQIELLKTIIAKDCTDDELKLFLMVCQRTALDPFTRQIYAIKRKGRMTIQTGIDGFRLIATRSHLYRGQNGPFWCGEDGTWVDVWLKKEPPAAAKVGVYVEGFPQPLYAVATWTEYRVLGNDGQLEFMWKQMPALMLGKCAEALALRRALPQELSGVYSDEEMGQAQNPTPAPRPVESHRVPLPAPTAPTDPQAITTFGQFWAACLKDFRLTKSQVLAELGGGTQEDYAGVPFSSLYNQIKATREPPASV